MKLFYTLKFSVAAFLIACTFSCAQKEDPADPQPAEPGIPETVEDEIIDLLGRDWKSLADTLVFFTEDMLLNGKFKGFGSDGVYYALEGGRDGDTVKLSFTVQDSIWLSARAANLLKHVSVCACDTEFSYDRLDDSTRFTLQNISATVPDGLPLPDDVVIPISYCQIGVGYIGFRYFENIDYTVKRCPVMYYYGDTRSFSFYEDLNFLSLADTSDSLMAYFE